jgi:hypothetical protein
MAHFVYPCQCNYRGILIKLITLADLRGNAGTPIWILELFRTECDNLQVVGPERTLCRFVMYTRSTDRILHIRLTS